MGFYFQQKQCDCLNLFPFEISIFNIDVMSEHDVPKTLDTLWMLEHVDRRNYKLVDC